MLTHRARLLRIALVVLALALLWPVVPAVLSSTDAMPQTNITLLAPTFIQTAHAADDALSTIEREAGISAYYQIPNGLNLQTIKPLFRTLERETQDYLVGSIAVPNWYAESEDVHVYVHKDGWVLVYYLAADPTSKIFDWSSYTPGDIVTKFDTILKLIGDQLGVTAPSSIYYHFQYPNANTLLLIAERRGSHPQAVSDSFEIKLPDALTYYERSWSLSCTIYYGGELFLNEQSLQQVSCTHEDEKLEAQYGILTPMQLSVNSFHTLRVYSGNIEPEVFGGIALVYREQQ